MDSAELSRQMKAFAEPTPDEVLRELWEEEEWIDPSHPFCKVCWQKGTYFVHKERYQDLLSREAEGFDMFIDGVTKVARCKIRGGRVRIATLTPGEFEIIAEYIETKKNMRPIATKTGSAGQRSHESALKLFEKARAKVDVRLDRYEYRAFRLHKTTDRMQKSFEFDPPKGMSYCLVIPV